METSDHKGKTTTKDELNLVEFPFSLPCQRHPERRQEIRITERVTDPEGKPRLREWIVTGNPRYGLPLAIDEEVFLGAMHILHKNEFRDRRISFTQYRLLKLLSWPTNARAYKRLKRSVDRLKGVVIESRAAFWDHKAKSYVTRAFNLIDNYALYEREGDAGTDQPFLSSITFNDFIFESFKAGFIKTLDFDFYLSLRLPIARKLFRFLDKKLYNGTSFEIDLMRLAQRLAITDSAYPSLVRKHLDPSHKELHDRGVIKGITYLRRGRSPAVRYTIADSSQWRRLAPPAKAQLTLRQHPLISELLARGITSAVAESLLAQHGETRVAEKLEVFDFLLKEQSPMVSKNSPGFLRQSIEKDYAPPSGYVSRAERERKKQEEDQRRRQKQEAEETAEKARLEKQTQVDAVWDSLSQAEKTQIDEGILASLDRFIVSRYHQECQEGRVGAGHHVLHAERARLLDERFLKHEQPTTTADPAPSTPTPAADCTGHHHLAEATSEPI